MCLPLTDSQDYDLIVDMDNVISRVQVKTTTYKSVYGVYLVNLNVKGGNRSGIGKIKKFDPTKVEYVFVATGEKDLYLIPSGNLGQTINLGKNLEDYKLNESKVL